jgi:AAHS family 4-hydroxybenzoate transporter-like MFS transporter
MVSVADVRRQVGGAALNAHHVRIIAIISCATIFDGYDNFIPSYIIHFTRDAWHLSPAQAGFLVSSGLIGFMIGALGNGPIADRFGRKPTLVAALLVAGAFSTFTGLWAHSFPAFVILRILTGVGLGVILPLSTAYMNELMPTRLSNVTTVLATGGYTIGGTLAGLAGFTLVNSFGWPILFLLGGSAILLAFICIAWLPESPLYLVGAGRNLEVREVMQIIAPDRFDPRESLAMNEQTKRQGSVALLLNATNRRTTILVWTVESMVLFNAYGLIGWIPTVMIQRGEAVASGFLFGALLQIASLLGGLTCSLFADLSGSRRAALTAWWTLGALSVIGLALINTHLTNILFVGISGMCVLGPLLVLNNLVAQLFETEVRSTAVGWALGVGRIGGIIGPVVAGWALQRSENASLMFTVIACSGLMSIGTVLTIPKTNLGTSDASG